MLTTTRSEGQKLTITDSLGNVITIIVHNITYRSRKCRLSIKAPRDFIIMREEAVDKNGLENRSKTNNS